MPSSLKHQVLHSLKWVALGKITTQIFRWVITFWVIRLLTPADYGIVALADAFFGLLQLLVSSLIAPTIIQSKELTKPILKKLFACILLIHGTIFIVQMSLAGVVGEYYNSQQVTDILEINAYCFLILALQIIPSAMLTREMQFKRISVVSAIANISAAFTTLALAYLGYGFWALVLGEFVAITLKTIMVLMIKPIIPIPSFRLKEVLPFLKFGSLLTAHGILFYIFLHMDVAIAGRYMSPTEVGLFALGLQFALMPQKKILPLLKEVAFPAFSKIQDQPELISKGVLKSQRLSALLILPIFWGLASVVDLIIPILLGDAWVPATVPVTIILLAMPLRFLEELYFPALKSQKAVKHMMINVTISLVVMTVSIFIGMKHGATGLALAWLCGFPAAFFLISYRNCKHFNIKLTSMYKQLFAPLVSAGMMFFAVYASKQVLLDINLVNLFAQIAIGGAVFIATMMVANKAQMMELINLVKKRS